MNVDALLARVDAVEIVRIVILVALVAVLAAVGLRVAPGVVNRIVDRIMDEPAADDTRGRLTFLEFEKRQRTLHALAGNTTRAIVLAIAVLALLSIFRVDLGPAIAGLGLIGLAVGLGAQGLVKDIVAGAFILAENQYARGDIVTIAGVTGTVDDVGLRRTLLRDFDGTVHVVPNGLIGVASNLTRVWARVVVDIPVKDPTRVDEATRLIGQVGADMGEDPAWRKRLLSAPRVDRVKQISASGVVLSAVGMVGAADRWSAAGELRKRIAEQFAAHGIELGGP